MHQTEQGYKAISPVLHHTKSFLDPSIKDRTLHRDVLLATASAPLLVRVMGEYLGTSLIVEKKKAVRNRLARIRLTITTPQEA